MPEQNRRIIVDGIDFANVFQFHRVLRAIGMALQPPRLIIALLMVTALMTAGHLWDHFATPTINPKGFLRGPIEKTDAKASQFVLRHALSDWNIPGPRNLNESLDARTVLTQVEVAALAKLQEGEFTRDRIQKSYDETVREIESVRPRGTFEATLEHTSRSFHRTINGVISLNSGAMFSGIYSLLVRTPVALWQRDKPFAICFGLFFVVVIALGGGAIARMVVCEVATGERLRIRDAVDFALESWPRLILTPLLPLLIMAGLCLVLAIAGAVGMLPWLDIAGGVLYGAALLIGFIVAFLMVGYASGFSLLIPAVAAENCDAADAQQRGYAYVLSRPFHFVGYALTSLVGMTIGFVIVSFVALVVITVTTAMTSLWNNNPAIHAGGERRLSDFTSESEVSPSADSSLQASNLRSDTLWDQPRNPDARWLVIAPLPNQLPLANAHERWAAAGVVFWQTLVASLVAAYVLAYYFAASTMTYLLLRKKCDGQDITEIWRAGMIPGTFTPIPDPEMEDADAE